MDILFINHYAGGPGFGMSFRSHYLAREWVKQGHNVTIIAASFSHLRRVNPTVTGPYSFQEIEGVKYIWCKTPSYKGNGLGRIINIFSFIKRLYSAKSELAKNYDVVIASSTYPLDIYPAHHLAKYFNAKLCWELHDLWPLSPILLGGISPYHPFMMLLQKGEKDCCRLADKVVSILPHADRHLITKGMLQEKYKHIPNGIDINEWGENNENELPDNIAKTIDKAKKQGEFIIGYAGSHGPSNGLMNLIKAAEMLKNEPVRFILLGDGIEKEQLKENAANRGLTSVEFFDSVPKKNIPNILSAMDCLYIGFRDFPLYKYGIGANKIFDYLMAARPTIFACNASNDPVKDAKAGISIEPDNSHQLTEAIREMMKTSPDVRETYGLNGRRYVMQNHNYKTLSHLFLEHIS